jgi:hypothetical protein
MIIAIRINTRPIIETTIGILLSPMIILNPVAMININPKTAKSKEIFDNKVFFI